MTKWERHATNGETWLKTLERSLKLKPKAFEGSIDSTYVIRYKAHILKIAKAIRVGLAEM